MARLEAAQSALDRLDELAEEHGGELPDAATRLRDLYRARFRMCQDVLAGEADGRARVRDERFRYCALRRELIGIERARAAGTAGRGSRCGRTRCGSSSASSTSRRRGCRDSRIRR